MIPTLKASALAAIDALNADVSVSRDEMRAHLADVSNHIDDLMRAIDAAGRCPKCNSDDYSKRHHEGNALAPDGSWFECNECGHKSEVS